MRMVTGQVDEKIFTVYPETLNESQYFFDLFSEYGHDYFRKYDLFEDRDAVLPYLRSMMFPGFWTQAEGHNLILYERLLVEAKYFKIPKLVQYLKEQKYLQALQSDTLVNTNTCFEAGKTGELIAFNMTTHPIAQWCTNRVYICPLGRHRGYPEHYDDQCRFARGKDDMIFEAEQMLKTAKVKVTTVVDRKVLTRCDGGNNW